MAVAKARNTTRRWRSVYFEIRSTISSKGWSSLASAAIVLMS